MWTPWEQVTAEIDSDHIVAAVWRGRLHLFWVTFLDEPKKDPGDVQDSTDTTQLENTTLNQIGTRVAKLVAKKYTRLQLNWSEYFLGEWTARESSGFGIISALVNGDFNPRSVFISVTKEYDEGEERAVKVHLGGAISRAFRIVSKNSRPTSASFEEEPPLPYSTTGKQATRHIGSGPLEVTFVDRIETVDRSAPKPVQVSKDILERGGNFSILRSGNETAFPNAEFAELVTPFFYQDDEHTFFVEPTLTEVTTEKWEEWVVPSPAPDVTLVKDDWWDKLAIFADVPVSSRPPLIDPVDPLSKFKIDRKPDWVTNPATMLQYGDRLIGQGGGVDLDAALPAGRGPGGIDVVGGIDMNDGAVLPGGALGADGPGLLTGRPAARPGRMMVVGGSGLSPALLANMNPAVDPDAGRGGILGGF
jgi:hypothetical protein